MTKARDSEILEAATAPVRRDAVSIKAAEDKVPLEWNVDDVILDLYEVKHIHSTGGMGLVYRVHHRNWNIDLAVKSPRAGFFETEEQKDDFVNECETWIDLGLHPNTVSCYYVRNLGRIPRVFAEYVEGGSLKDWIDDRKLYEGGKEKALDRILDTAIQFAWGLHFAHEKGLVHQDVKPANVMMTKDGTVKVTDFGLAKARAVVEGATGSGPQQSILVSCGGMTPAYCSPEQANMQQLSRKTDIWSWGLSVLEMFTGKATRMAGESALQSLKSYLQTGTEDTSVPMMPDRLAELLRKCFQNDPTDRPKDMQEIAKSLKQIYQHVTEKEYPRSEPKPADLLADALNNHAISMLDIGREQEAERLFDEALRIDSHHIESTYNRGLLLWRSGRITDDALVNQLEEVRTTHEHDWRDEYYLGLVHIERGDMESAIKILEEALRIDPDMSEIRHALIRARSSQEDLPSGMALLGALQWVHSISIRGGWVLVGNSDAL